MYLLIQKLDLAKHGAAVLHIAPEEALANKLHLQCDDYTIGDIRLAALSHLSDSMKKAVMDLSDLREAGSSYDLILHSHVMEHVRGSWQLAFLRLHAMLKPGGSHVFALPIRRDWSCEDLSDMDTPQRRRRFGQHDHYRYIGRRDFTIDMRNIVALTKSRPLIAARDVLSDAEMSRIAGDPDVFALIGRS